MIHDRITAVPAGYIGPTSDALSDARYPFCRIRSLYETRYRIPADDQTGGGMPHDTACGHLTDKTAGAVGCTTEWRIIIMAKYRKLGRTSDQRKALLRSQVTALLYHGRIVTTEARAKEVRKLAEKMIALAIKEADNYEEVTVKAKVARKDKDGKRVREVVDGKRVTVYDEVDKKIKKDLPSRLHARRQMLKVLYPVVEKGSKKRETKKVDLPDKLFTEIAPKYKDRQGGYTRIVKIGPRKGDAAMEVVLELV